MPTDIASAVTATYDASIPVPLDGELCNSAALQAMTVAVANRVEFLRQGQISDPWRRVEYREDFPRAELDGEVLTAENAWTLYQTSPVLTVSATPGATNEHGVLSLANVTGSSAAALLTISNAAAPATMSQVETLALKFRTASIATGHGVEFGVYNTFNLAVDDPVGNGIGWMWKPSVSPNWLLRSVKTGLVAYVDSGIAVAADTYYTVRIDQVSPGTFQGRIDSGSPITVVSQIPVPAATCGFQTRMIMPNSGTRTFLIDFMYARFDLAGRVL